ncbi:DNA polymerase III subunit gamma/tau [uncultured Helicobacter sp.]|uniref:DNA polymerase III subunit gamma/tau n=1 Tax=uncultured Helicobacter sp. TaxID=175537 RepID=UPI00262E295C|nr:DNA polymerase III subunit gamma/tau [uncultured Helicobacter sp.]
MNSTALALKYRPTCFSDLIGQNAISQTLSLALDSKHISHAYLFSGLRGSGKTSSARIFARALQCESGPTSTPCGTCASCVAALQNRHIDIIEMDAASSRGIDDIKRVIEQTKYSPSFARYKIFIIDEVHMLSKEAFNALLKTLEEPPEFVKFILATTDPLKLPATILSRTQHFRFKQIPHRLVIEHISNILNKEGVSYEAQALDIIARSGAGSLRDTLTLLDQAIIFCKNHIEVAAISEMLGVVDPQVLGDYFLSIVHKDEAKTHGILEMLFEYECKMILDEMMLFLKDKLLQKDNDFPPLLLDRFARILSESKSLLSLNTDGVFVLLLCTLKMQEAMKVKDIESMIEELENELFGQQDATHIQNRQNPLSPSIPHTSPTSPTPMANTTNTITPTPAQTPPATTAPLSAKMRFDTLITKLKDRNEQLGVAFEHNVRFVEFIESSHLLRWQSVAQGADKALLKEHSKIVFSLVRAVFGDGTQIEQVTTQEPLSQDTTHTSQSPTPSLESTTNTMNTDIAQPTSIPHTQSLAAPTPNIPNDAQSTETQNVSSSDSKQAFLNQNKDLIMAINESVGIKKVITKDLL